MSTFILKNNDDILVYFNMHAPLILMKFIMQGSKPKPWNLNGAFEVLYNDGFDKDVVCPFVCEMPFVECHLFFRMFCNL
jgi:hypothetical protein